MKKYKYVMLLQLKYIKTKVALTRCHDLYLKVHLAKGLNYVISELNSYPVSSILIKMKIN